MGDPSGTVLNSFVGVVPTRVTPAVLRPVLLSRSERKFPGHVAEKRCVSTPSRAPGIGSFGARGTFPHVVLICPRGRLNRRGRLARPVVISPLPLPPVKVQDSDYLPLSSSQNAVAPAT